MCSARIVYRCYGLNFDFRIIFFTSRKIEYQLKPKTNPKTTRGKFQPVGEMKLQHRHDHYGGVSTKFQSQ
jgi:hypothetical protein